MRLSEEKVGGFRNYINKIWNISRYIVGNYDLKNISFADIDESKLTFADKWILHELNNLIKEVTDDIENYKFSSAGEKLYGFTWNTLADWYVEFSKFEKDGEKEKVFSFVLINLLKLLHPFMPFVTEKIWDEIGIDNLLLIQKWPEEFLEKKIFDTEKEIIESTIGIIQKIREARNLNKIEPAKKIKAVIFAHDKYEEIKSQEDLIKNYELELVN